MSKPSVSAITPPTFGQLVRHCADVGLSIDSRMGARAAGSFKAGYVEALRLLSSDRAVQPEEVLNCEWAIDDKGGDSVYETNCGHNFYFDDSSGADENSFRHCPYCGRRLIEVKTSEAVND